MSNSPKCSLKVGKSRQTLATDNYTEQSLVTWRTKMVNCGIILSYLQSAVMVGESKIWNGAVIARKMAPKLWKMISSANHVHQVLREKNIFSSVKYGKRIYSLESIERKAFWIVFDKNISGIEVVVGSRVGSRAAAAKLGAGQEWETVNCFPFFKTADVLFQNGQ